MLGHKIYYDKLTGNVILITGEMQGDVRETTKEEDFQSFVALQQRVPETVGCVQLEYGQYADKLGLYEFHVDPITEQMVWGELINPDTPLSKPTLEEQVAQFKEDNLILMDALATTFEEVISLRADIAAGGTV
jgi:hypothetical protein